MLVELYKIIQRNVQYFDFLNVNIFHQACSENRVISEHDRFEMTSFCVN